MATASRQLDTKGLGAARRSRSRVGAAWLLRCAPLALIAACASSATHSPAAQVAAADSGLVTRGLDAGAGTTNVTNGDAVPSTDAATRSSSDAALALDAAASSVASIDTPADQWTWLPIDGARCANGTPTGVGINRSTVSNDLVIMLEGGGACWDADTCITTPAAVHLQDTYDATLFASDFVVHTSPVMRDPNNPFATATTVFVPYCTGDLHAGDVTRTYSVGGTTRQVQHVGARNIDAALARLRSGLPLPHTVWVLGSSAGGYGATLNFAQIAAAFPGAQLHMLADCAPLVTPAGARFSTWRTAWQMRTPLGCNNCDTSFGSVIDALATKYPSSRIGLLAFAQDATIASYFGFDGPTLQQQLDALLAASYQHPATRYFVAPGSMHTMLGSVATQKAGDGTTLQAWLTAWMLGLPSWQNAR